MTAATMAHSGVCEVHVKSTMASSRSCSDIPGFHPHRVPMFNMRTWESLSLLLMISEPAVYAGITGVFVEPRYLGTLLAAAANHSPCA